MRAPRKPESYLPAALAAKGLREIADDLEKYSEMRPLVKWYINLWYWNPEWLTAPKKKQKKVVA